MATELLGPERTAAIATIRTSHYTHSVPSGKSHYFRHGDALVVFSIPANQFVGKFLFGVKRNVWELSRLWAPDGHERNLLTRAISRSVRALKQREPGVWGLVSYADPNVGHAGFVYRAASWLACGQVEESRYYRSADGTVVSRRKFHSGGGLHDQSADSRSRVYGDETAWASSLLPPAIVYGSSRVSAMVGEP